MRPISILCYMSLKDYSNVTASFRHNHRLTEVTNADPSRFSKNRVLVGSPDDDIVGICRARAKSAPKGKRAVLMGLFILNVSPGFFGSGESRDPDDPAFGERVDAFVTAAMGWARERFGDNLLSAVLHLDEMSPHIHLMVQPLDGDGKLGARNLFEKCPDAYSRLQTSYAEALSGLGVARAPRSLIRSPSLKRVFYPMAKEFAKPWETPVPGPEDFRPKSGFFAGPAKRCERIVRAFADRVFADLAKDFVETAKESERLRHLKEEVSREADEAFKEISLLKEKAKEIRGHDVRRILDCLCGTKTMGRGKAKIVGETPNGLKIEAFSKRWTDLSEPGIGGEDPISLLCHVKGYGEANRKQAVRDLADMRFPGVPSRENTMSSLLRHRAKEILPKLVLAAKSETAEFPGPVASEKTWPELEKTLSDALKLTPGFADGLRSAGFLDSDPFGDLILRSPGLEKKREALAGPEETEAPARAAIPESGQGSEFDPEFNPEFDPEFEPNRDQGADPTLRPKKLPFRNHFRVRIPRDDPASLSGVELISLNPVPAPFFLSNPERPPDEASLTFRPMDAIKETRDDPDSFVLVIPWEEADICLAGMRDFLAETKVTLLKMPPGDADLMRAYLKELFPERKFKRKTTRPVSFSPKSEDLPHPRKRENAVSAPAPENTGSSRKNGRTSAPKMS
ncbi:MAG: plasmid recombination protein [Deltaproteobacteria bacterium]|jgi:hypothetical protein|nr:plasmid recombination protein [Deltaproteobacteria bacterium]